jgi:HEAT repeat protein
MKNRRFILLLVGCFLLLGLLAGLIFFGQREPHYQGRSLSSWLSDVSPVNYAVTSKSAAMNLESAAIAAVQKMGPEADPFLIRMLKAKDGPFRKAIIGKLGWQRSMKLGLVSADEKQVRARLTLYKLGTNAAVAWKQILMDPTFDANLRTAAMSWCQTLPEEAPRMLPVMLRLMTDLKPDEQEFATWAIRRFGLDAAVPLLVNKLQDEDRKIQLMAMRGLRSFGRSAKAAIPSIAQRLKNSDEEVGIAASDTLLSLDAHNLPALVYRMHHGELGKRVGAYWMTAREEREPEFVIPEFMRGLTDAEPEIRQAAAEGLTKFGVAAQPALPALTNLLGDSKRYVRVAATNAIAGILPRATKGP